MAPYRTLSETEASSVFQRQYLLLLISAQIVQRLAHCLRVRSEIEKSELKPLGQYLVPSVHVQIVRRIAYCLRVCVCWWSCQCKYCGSRAEHEGTCPHKSTFSQCKYCGSCVKVRTFVVVRRRAHNTSKQTEHRGFQKSYFCGRAMVSTLVAVSFGTHT